MPSDSNLSMSSLAIPKGVTTIEVKFNQQKKKLALLPLFPYFYFPNITFIGIEITAMLAWVLRNGWTLNFGTPSMTAFKFLSHVVIELQLCMWEWMRYSFHLSLFLLFFPL
jgi:hypothetical protein